jgi:hypothetical protein
MSAEIIVIVENQDASRGIQLAKEICGRESADSAPNHDQVQFFAGFPGGAGFLPEIGVANVVCDLEGTGVASAEPGQRRRVVVRGFFGIQRVIKCCGQRRRQQGRPGGYRDAVQEIAAGDTAIHPQVFVAVAVAVVVVVTDIVIVFLVRGIVHACPRAFRPEKSVLKDVAGEFRAGELLRLS